MPVRKEDSTAGASATIPRGVLLRTGVERVYYGPGCAGQELRECLGAMGLRRALLVSSKTLAAGTDAVANLRGNGNGAIVETFLWSRLEGVEEQIARGVEVARAVRADALISLGGGGVVDGAKCIALALAEGPDLEACRVRCSSSHPPEVPVLPNPKLPHLAVPTTLTGCEFTQATGIFDGKRRNIFIDPKLLPRAVFLDPALTLTTPRDLWASTAVKVIDHAVERIYATTSNPLTDALGVKAIEAVMRWLPVSLREPANLSARLELQMASLMTGMGWGRGLAHAFTHVLEARCGVPDSLVAGIVLPHAIEYNEKAALAKLPMIAGALGVGRPEDHGSRDGAACAAAIKDLLSTLGLPLRLRDIGVPADALGGVAGETMSDIAMATNPRRPADPAELLRVLEAAW